MTKTNVTYALERGIQSPRDGSVSFQLYDNFATLPEAKSEAGRAVQGSKSHWRIVRSETVWVKEPE